MDDFSVLKEIQKTLEANIIAIEGMQVNLSSESIVATEKRKD